jgi:hypothetical protein
MERSAWSARAKGGISWFLAGGSWLLDRLYGDHIFAAVKPMIPQSLQSWETALSSAIAYGPPLILVALGLYFFVTAAQLHLVMIGDLMTVHHPIVGGGFILVPVRARSGQVVACRVVMEIQKPDGSYAYPQYVLLSEQALMRRDRRVGRVNIDDVPKRFELFDYDCGRGVLRIRHEVGDREILATNYRLQIIVAGAGPAKRKQFFVQMDGLDLRIGDGTERGLRVLNGPEPWITKEQQERALLDSPGFVPCGDLLIRALGEMKEKGAQHLGALIPVKPDFDYEVEVSNFEQWRERVKFLLQEYPHHVTDIGTLTPFDAKLYHVEGKAAGQQQMEAIWREALIRLARIIHELGTAHRSA